MGIIINETDIFTYPSITFCYKFRDNANLVEVLREAGRHKGTQDIGKIDLNEIIANIRYKDEGLISKDSLTMRPSLLCSYERTAFLSAFRHSETGKLLESEDILHNNSYWHMTIPHPQDAGVCYTYNPPFQSSTAPGHGIR